MSDEELNLESFLGGPLSLYDADVPWPPCDNPEAAAAAVALDVPLLAEEVLRVMHDALAEAEVPPPNPVPPEAALGVLDVRLATLHIKHSSFRQSGIFKAKPRIQAGGVRRRWTRPPQPHPDWKETITRTPREVVEVFRSLLHEARTRQDSVSSGGFVSFAVEVANDVLNVQPFVRLSIEDVERFFTIPRTSLLRALKTANPHLAGWPHRQWISLQVETQMLFNTHNPDDITEELIASVSPAMRTYFNWMLHRAHILVRPIWIPLALIGVPKGVSDITLKFKNQ